MLSSLQRLLNMCHDLKATEDRYVQSKGPAVHNNAWHKLHHFGLHGPLDLRGKLSPWENVAGQSHGEDCLLGRRVVVGHQLSQRLRLLLLLLLCSVCCLLVGLCCWVHQPAACADSLCPENSLALPICPMPLFEKNIAKRLYLPQSIMEPILSHLWNGGQHLLCPFSHCLSLINNPREGGKW